MLEIKNLQASVNKKSILKGLNLTIKPGELHAIMGPNGSGKSTLSNVLCGKEGYEIKQGEIKFKNKNLIDLGIDERSHLGLFLAFQYPVELPGVSITPFMRTALNSKLKAKGLLARCVQHEYDHIEGILFIDHLSKIKKDIILRKLQKKQKGKEQTT